MARNSRIRAMDRNWTHTVEIHRIGFLDRDKHEGARVAFTKLFERLAARLPVEGIDDLGDICELAYRLGKRDERDRAEITATLDKLA